mgnify:FL=1
MRFLRSRIDSFRYAFAGFRTLVATQPNARIHLAATLLVTISGIVFGISTTEWAMVLLAIGMIWMAEALNTSIEFLADEITLERRPRIKVAKDVAAFGVLACALVSTGIGLIVFLPHLRSLFEKLLPGP